MKAKEQSAAGISPTAEAEQTLRLRLIAVLAGVGLFGLVAFLLSHPVVDQDVWHEIALARVLFETGTLPMADPFAYTPTVPFIQHEWGAGVLALLSIDWFGATGLALLKFALGGLLALFLVLRLRMEKTSLVVLAPVTILALNMIQPGFGTVRAQIYSLVAVAALLWCLALDRKGSRRWIWLWMPLFVVWLNVHGGFVVAFGLLGAEWLERAAKGRRDWHLVAVGAAMLGAVALNPYGLRYYAYMLDALTIRRPDIKEWQPIWVAASEFPASVTAFVLTIPVVAYAVYRRGWREVAGLGPLLLLLVASVRTNRLAMFYGVAFLATVPAMLEGTGYAAWADRKLRRWSAAVFPVTAILALLLVASAWQRQPWRVLVPGAAMPAYGKHVVYPVGAVDYLKRHRFHGNLMVSFPIGAYVLWKLAPEVKVSIDSRYEVAYEPAFAERFIRVYRTAEGAGTILESYPHDALLVEADSPVRAEIESGGRWKAVYEDASYFVYARSDSRLPVERNQRASPDGTIP